MSVKTIQVGQTLPNGYTVLAIYSNLYVLAVKETASQPYAVWNIDNDGDTYNGRYRVTLEAAQKEFIESFAPWFNKDELEEKIQSEWTVKCIVEPLGVVINEKPYTFKGYKDYIGSQVVVTMKFGILSICTLNGEEIMITATPHPHLLNHY